jgi:hypothetical protein
MWNVNSTLGNFFTNRNKLGIECNNLSKFFKRHGWQGVYHHIPILDFENIISIVAALQRGGSNRGDKNCSNNFSTDSIDV